jgi:ribosomal protein S18 acetylase RimI-like enzyme
MAGRKMTPTPIPLTHEPITCDSAAYHDILAWPYKEEDTYVRRLLQTDIPIRVWAGYCEVWIYRNPDRQVVGFGTLDLCDDWKEYTGGKLHTYIPLLAVNPGIKSKGYGTRIVEHLIDAAGLTVLANAGTCHDVLFLDVYTSNAKGIDLYARLGFQRVEGAVFTDEDEGGKEYIVMAKRVSVAAS